MRPLKALVEWGGNIVPAPVPSALAAHVRVRYRCRRNQKKPVQIVKEHASDPGCPGDGLKLKGLACKLCEKVRKTKRARCPCGTSEPWSLTLRSAGEKFVLPARGCPLGCGVCAKRNGLGNRPAWGHGDGKSLAAPGMRRRHRSAEAKRTAQSQAAPDRAHCARLSSVVVPLFSLCVLNIVLV